MKSWLFVPSLLLCLPVSAHELPNDSSLYLLGGVSIYEENSDTATGAGLGYKLVLGIQLNDTFGFETGIDISHAADSSDVENGFIIENSDFFERIGATSDDFILETETYANRYLSLVATVTYSSSDWFALVGKVGITSYWQKTKFTMGFKEGRDQTIVTTLKGKEWSEGYAPTVTVAGRFPVGDDNALLSLTQIFSDDAGATSLNLSYQFNF